MMVLLDAGSSDAAYLLSPAINITAPSCLILDLHYDGPQLSFSIYRLDEGVDLEQAPILTNIDGYNLAHDGIQGGGVMVNLSLGEYRVLFSAVGSESYLRLHAVNVTSGECQSSGGCMRSADQTFINVQL